MGRVSTKSAVKVPTPAPKAAPIPPKKRYTSLEDVLLILDLGIGYGLPSLNDAIDKIISIQGDNFDLKAVEELMKHGTLPEASAPKGAK